VSIGDQIAGDFAGIVADIGTTATVAGKSIDGVLAAIDGSFSLEEGGMGEAVTSRFRYDPQAQGEGSLGFIPQAGARLVANGKTFRVAGVDSGGSHRLVSLSLSQQR